MKPRTSEAQSTIDALNAELAANGQARSVALSWSPREVELLGQLGSTIDRRVDIAAVYAKAVAKGDDPKLIVHLSAELRLLDKAAAAIMAAIETDAPQPESLTTTKARMAANTRWQQTREREAR
jgi:hypothetical protein